MNWINALCELYDKNIDQVGKLETIILPGGTAKNQKKNEDIVKKYILLPESHSSAMAQIEVVLNERGDFISAKRLEKNEAFTPIPVTEKSGSRTSGVAPHPLCDVLKYLAGDYDSCVENKEKSLREFYDEYIDALQNWCNSKNAHPKAIAILNYLKRGVLIQDLIKIGVLTTNENGKVDNNEKIQKSIKQADAFVRFLVESSGTVSPEERLSDNTGKYGSEVWLDQTLQKSFIEYYRSMKSGEVSQKCYLTGEFAVGADLHPGKIRNDGDKAKLISSDDSANFTYRGRFNDKDQAFFIGYESSQKAHNALKWLIRKQGYLREGLCLVVWESDLNPIFSLYSNPTANLDTPENSLEDLGEDEDFLPDINEKPKKESTGYITASEFKAALDGYHENLNDLSQMVIMALDSATLGRLAMTYFNMLPTSQYLNGIKQWHESCCWLHSVIHKNKRYEFEGMAALKDIALALYGTEQNKNLTLKSGSDGKATMLISTFNRLIPCILNGAKIPKDIVRRAILRASSPLLYDNVFNWQMILAVACSLVKKEDYDYNNNKENWKMALDLNCTNRSYLFGRLLAVADVMEHSTYDKDDAGKRQTNAIRMMNMFSRSPYKTWKILNEHLIPYRAKMKPGSVVYYEKIIQEIMDLLDLQNFSSPEPLEGCYLLGFYCQKKALYTAKESEKTAGQDSDESSVEN